MYATRTVYNGGKVDLSAPPCNATAPRRGYSIWAPVGIVQNYTRPDKTVTQEWEMANDLGDSHPLSLRQGGQLPPNSLDCRLVGMIFPEANLPIDIYSYPLNTNQNYKVLLVNEQCVTIDSVVGRGILNLKSVAPRANWHAIKVQNADTTNSGQKLFVKIEYTGDKNVNTRQFYKPTCSCIYKATPQNSNYDFEPSQDLVLFPNPVNSTLFVQSFQPLLNEIEVKSITGQSIFKTQNVYSSSIEIDTQLWSNGIYILVAKYENFSIFKKFSVQN